MSSNRKTKDAVQIETRRMNAHENLIFSVIQRQAGSLEKALLEGIMNAIDAGATTVSIELDASRFVIADDGRGFRDRNEIETCFETFGTPHELDAHGRPLDAEYGTFRMGRGQLFAFARTDWRSNQWEMCVDVKGKGLDYTLKQHPTRQPGCVITGELYAPLTRQTLDATIDGMGLLCRYVSIPVLLNGQRVSVDPKELEWDLETKDYWLRYKDLSTSRGLDVYQKGVFVCTISHHKLGISGTLVTKQNLVLNMARNDVMSTCPLMSRLKRKLQQLGTEYTRLKQGNLDSNEIAVTIAKWLSRELPVTKLGKVRMFTDVTGRRWSMDDIRTIRRRGSGWHVKDTMTFGVALAALGDVRGDRAMQLKRGFVLDESLLHLLPDAWKRQQGQEALAESFIRRLDQASRPKERSVLNPYIPMEITGLDELSNIQETSFRLIAPEDLSEDDIRKLDALSQAQWGIAYEIRAQLPALASLVQHRTIRAGESSHAAAWTDGASYVAFNYTHIRNPKDWDFNHFMFLIAALLHELLHTSSSHDGHIHSPEFYQNFHDVMLSPNFGSRIVYAWRRWVDSTACRRKINGKALSDLKTLLLEQHTRAQEK